MLDPCWGDTRPRPATRMRRARAKCRPGTAIVGAPKSVDLFDQTASWRTSGVAGSGRTRVCREARSARSRRSVSPGLRHRAAKPTGRGRRYRTAFVEPKAVCSPSPSFCSWRVPPAPRAFSCAFALFRALRSGLRLTILSAPYGPRGVRAALVCQPSGLRGRHSLSYAAANSFAAADRTSPRSGGYAADSIGRYAWTQNGIALPDRAKDRRCQVASGRIDPTTSGLEARISSATSLR